MHEVTPSVQMIAVKSTDAVLFTFNWGYERDVCVESVPKLVSVMQVQEGCWRRGRTRRVQPARERAERFPKGHDRVKLLPQPGALPSCEDQRDTQLACAVLKIFFIRDR